jgi:hypothetical protein
MRAILISVLLLIISLNNLYAGWIIRMQYDNYGIKEMRTYTIARDYLKISYGQHDFIYDGESKQIRVVNHRIKSYYIGSFEEYITDLEMLREVNGDIADLILPQSWFYSFNKLLADKIADNRSGQMQTAAAVRVENTGKNSNIAGKTAREYKVYLDKDLLEQIWLSRDVNLANDVDFLAAVNFFRGINGNGLSGNNQLDLTAFEQLAYRGFPMRIVQYDNSGMEAYREECLMIQKQDIEIETSFFPPASYRSRTLIDVIIAE